MKFKNYILASDVDGTLMEQGYISPRNFEKINEFVAQGGIFCIATGRCPAAMKHIVSQFDNLNNVIYYNGGMVYDYINKKILINKTLVDGDKKFFVDVSNKISEIGIEVYHGDQVYMVRESEGCRVHFEYEHIPIEYASFEDVLDIPWNKIMTYYKKDYDEKNLEKEIAGFLSDTCEFARAAGFINGEFYCGYEQLPKGANKGQGLLELANLLNVPRENIFAIGDYYNDIEMLNVAGISACPVESPDDIKEKVDFVAGSCRQGAVADFIEYLQNKAI